MKLRQSSVLLLFFAFPAMAACPEDRIGAAFESSVGLCIFVGNAQTFADCYIKNRESQSNAIWHCLLPDADSVQNLRKELSQAKVNNVLAETFNSKHLPHIDNLANLVVIENPRSLASGEAMRVVQPGGSVFHCDRRDPVVKPSQGGADEWSHQWHGTDGGLTTEQTLGVPTGVQWLAGPLFAMAGRKSSTQSLVTSNGVNFYVTQNVLENVGRPVEKMEQYLVARDSYNGLQRWQIPWTGPYVSGKGETNPRLIATPDMLYAVQEDQAVVGIHPRTGERLTQFNVDGKIEKLLFSDSILYIQTQQSVSAADQALEKELWRFESKNLSGLTCSQGSIFLLSAGRSDDGRFRHDLICLNAKNGKLRYRCNTQPNVQAASVRVNFVNDGIVALQSHGFLHVFSAESGEYLWSKSTQARPGKDYVDERYVGHFYRRGLVWMLTQNSPRESTGQNLWLALDPRTGEVRRELETSGDWPRTATPAKMGCQVLIASDRYVLVPRQSTYIDLNTGEKHSFKFTRGGCGLGFVPANGLLYSHPHACGCFSEAIRGFMGMHSHNTRFNEVDPSDRLITYAVSSPPTSADVPVGWSTHRATSRRGGYLDVAIPGDLTISWQYSVGQLGAESSDAWQLRCGSPITSATEADGTVIVADVNQGRVLAIETDSGKLIWDHYAAGRIDSPPTLTGSSCLFGSHDGHVYCLNRKTGERIWKYRAAPKDQRIVAFGGIESSWPVTGSVLVQNGIAFVAAGRGPDADGGIHVTALDASSGKSLWTQLVQDDNFWGLSDYLIGGEQSVFLSNRSFSVKDGRQFDTTLQTSEHLRGGKVGLLEASWTRHDLANRKDIQTWTARGVSGQLLAFGPHAVASWNAENAELSLNAKEQFTYSLQGNEQITAMAMGNNYLVVAGSKDRSQPTKGGFLRSINIGTGQIDDDLDLPVEPIFDGLSLTERGILVSLIDGKLVFLEGK